MIIYFEIDDQKVNKFVADVLLNVDIFHAIGYWAVRSEWNGAGWRLKDEEGKTLGFLGGHAFVKRFFRELYKAGRSIENYDMNAVDFAVQRAMFGEVKYG